MTNFGYSLGDWHREKANDDNDYIAYINADFR